MRAFKKAGDLARRKSWEIRSREAGRQDTLYARVTTKSKYSFALHKLPREGTIVDVGIGEAVGIKETGAAKRFVGLDYNPNVLKIAREENPEMRKRLIRANATEIPFKNVSAITAFELIEHLSAKEKEMFLQGAKRALKNGGMLVISTPLSFRPKTLNPYHRGKELTLPQLKILLDKYFNKVEYYGMGEQPRTLGKRLAVRMQELLRAVDVLDIRKKVVPRRVRSITLQKLKGTTEIKSLLEYLKEGKLPETIVAVVKK